MKTKNIITVISCILFGISCKAQNPVIDISDRNGEFINGAYYKDVNNILTPFEGTYVYDDGVNYLKIVFQKKVMQFTGSCYQDLLIGEFQYKKNGVEIVNTLNKLTDPLPNVAHHSIDGNFYMTNHTPFDDYTTDNFRLTLGMVIPGGITANLDVRKCVVNGQEAIQIFKRTRYDYVDGETVPPVIVPNGFFFLIKQ
ncbi:MAG: DUF6705 family protein [Flavobacterium sp.]|uniref:DUF6705 family protein n=1 Tax=Flavobacterium sp. TaxID=239 RepID=UPI0037A4262E